MPAGYVKQGWDDLNQLIKITDLNRRKNHDKNQIQFCGILMHHEDSKGLFATHQRREAYGFAQYFFSHSI